MPRNHTVLLLATLLLLVAISGCGGGDTFRAQHKLTVQLDDYLLRPQNASVAAGELSLSVVNDGARAHNLRIRYGKRDLGGTGTLAPGERKSVVVEVPHGYYQTVSTLADDETLGLYGTLRAR